MKKLLLLTWHGGTGGIAVLVLGIVKNLLHDFNIEVCFIHELGPIAEEVRSLGIPVHLIAMRNGLDIPGFLKLKRFLNRSDFDLVHVFYITPLVRLAVYLSKYSKQIVSEHGGANRDKELGRWWVVKQIHRILKNTAAIYTFPSYSSLHELRRERIFPQERCRVIHNGIDLKEFSGGASAKSDIREKLNIGKETIVIGTVRGLTSKMGIDHMIKAVELVSDEFPDVCCLIVGDGPLRGTLEKLAFDAGISDKTRFLGTQRNIPLLLSCFDIFIMPSVWETFGIAAIEAMAMKVPVIAYDVGGLREAIGNAGILIPERNFELLSREILSLIADPDKRLSLGEKGRERVLEKFDIRVMAEAYNELYLDFMRTSSS